MSLTKPKGINNQIGKNLKRLRKNSKLTQQNLADVLGVTFQQIQKFEYGENRLFCHQAAELCNEFGWDMNEFRASESSVQVPNS